VLLWALGCCLLMGRFMHAVGLMTNAKMPTRLVGMALTLTVLSGSGLLCIWSFFR
jgi:uncharacterized membrane protein YecN with MAPEG domain